MWTQTVTRSNCNQQHTYCREGAWGRDGWHSKQPKEKNTASAVFFVKLTHDLDFYEYKERLYQLRWRSAWLLQSNSRPSRQPCHPHFNIDMGFKSKPWGVPLRSVFITFSVLSDLFCLNKDLVSLVSPGFLHWYSWLLGGCFCNWPG